MVVRFTKLILRRNLIENKVRLFVDVVGAIYGRLLGIMMVALLLSASIDSHAQVFDEKLSTASQMRLAITNLGTFGNAFRGYRDGSGTPSCEYPAGSGIEHLFEAGVWVGAGGNRVSTAALDAPQGYQTGARGFEMTIPPGQVFVESSSLEDSPFFNPNATSHQDFKAVFTDSNILVPGTSTPITGHDFPLNVSVAMETYNWNFPFTDYFVIVNLYVVNENREAYDSVYVGLWANTVVRNINITPAGQGGSTFYSQGGNGYEDTMQLAYAWDIQGDVGFTDSYIGQKFLGAEYKGQFMHPNLEPPFATQNFNVHYNPWFFNDASNQLFAFPSSEQARWQKMTQGINFSPQWESLQDDLATPGNRSDLISAGPFYDFDPGDTINITFAFVAGRKQDDGNPNFENTIAQREIFYRNADWAQTAYYGEDRNRNGILDPGEDLDGDGKITRYILPAPPDIPVTRVEPVGNQIDIYWSDNAEFSIDPISLEKDFEGYRVYVSKPGFDVTGTQTLELNKDLIRVAEYDIPGNNIFNDIGFEPVMLDEPVTFEDDPTIYKYKYSVRNANQGWQYAVSVTSFDRGEPENNLESLESSVTANITRVFPGTPANDNPDEHKVYAYPNPYYAGAAWEGRSNFQEESRKLVFANLPERCVIRVFTPAGDLIDEINHDPDYDGSDIRWFRTFAAENPEDNKFSGGEHAWDLLSRESQIIARGLYIFTVEDKDTGKFYKGKFMVIK